MSATPSPSLSKPYAGLLPVVASVEVSGDRKNRFAKGWSLLGKIIPLAFARYQIAFFIGVAAALAWQAYGGRAREGVANSYPQLSWLASQPARTASNAPELITQAAPAVASTDQQGGNPVLLDVDGMRQSIDRIAASQEQIARGVDQLAAGQVQMTRSIDRMTASEGQITSGVDQLAAVQEQTTRNVDRIAASQEQIAHGIDQLVAAQEQMTREIAKLQEAGRSVGYKNSEPPVRPAVVPTRNPAPGSSPAPSPKAITVESRAELGSLQRDVPLDIKATDANLQQTLSERGKQLFAANGHESTCQPSASAVLQNYPGASPSWTLRAPGHEGTKCWYAATRRTMISEPLAPAE